MNDPLLNIKNLFSDNEKQSLQFNKSDREIVFRKIEIANNNPPSKNRKRIKAIISYTIMPIAVIVITFMVLLQTSMKQQVLAAIPYLHSLFSDYGDEGQKEAVKKTDVQHINQTVESNGVRITFNEILYDGARISVAYSIEATNGNYKGQDLNIFLFDMKVDGNDITSDHGFSGTQQDKKLGNQYVKVQNININQALPKEFTLNLSIQELVSANDANQSIKGNWNFSLPVKKTGQIYEYLPKLTKKTDIGEIRVKKISFAPSGTELEIETKQRADVIKNKRFISYRILDPDHKEIKGLGGYNTSFHYIDGIGIGETKITLPPLAKIPKYIMVQPYYRGFKFDKMPKDTIKGITEKLPIFLPQGKNGGIMIKKIEKKPGEVLVRFDVVGDFVQFRRNGFGLIKGKERTPGSYIERDYDFNSEKRKNQTVKFKTPYSEDLNFITNDDFPELINEWEMKIHMNKKEFVKS